MTPEQELACCDEMIANVEESLRKTMDLIRRYSPEMHQKMLAYYRREDPELYARLNLGGTQTN